MSGGEQQMLAMARALLLNPRLLLLDEPSTGLAPLFVAEIFAIVEDLRRDLGVSILLIEQSVTGALRVSDRAYVLKSGQVVAEGRSEELAADENIQAYYLGR
jgi:branched-chain amino acid transport system ATP-binding protein